MGGRFRFPFPDKKIPPVAVEFPVTPPGIIPGYIGPVIGQIVGPLETGGVPLGIPPGLDIHRDGFLRGRGQGQKTGASVLGYGEKNPEKPEAVGDDDPIVAAVIGPPLRNLKKTLIPADFIGIKNMTDNPPVPGGEPQLVPEEYAGQTEKPSLPGPVPGQKRFPPAAGADVSYRRPDRQGDTLFFMGPGEDQNPQKTIGQDREENGIHQGKDQFPPQPARGKSQHGEEPHRDTEKLGYGYYAPKRIRRF
jgi:hypothetical protein